jgi:rRNA pseudouridine-1189 N-methylase Emg1 (Nep1/Mra1 family)
MKHVDSRMSTACTEIERWSASNSLNINIRKTKERFIGLISNRLLKTLTTSNNDLVQIDLFKLTDVVISNNLKLHDHVTAICNTANKRLYFLMILKRSKTSVDDLLC